MNQYNPYAAPVAQRVAPDGPPPVGAPEPWSTGDALSVGWATYKIHWAPLTIGYFVMVLLGALPGQIPAALVATGILRQGTTEYWLVSGPSSLTGWLITTFFTCGFIRASLKTIRGQTPTFGDFFSGTSFLSVLAVSILSGIAVVFGLILLIVPGIILSLGFFNAPFYVVDQRMGPIEALKASWDSTSGQKGDVFVFNLLAGLLTIAGVLACCVGIFAVGPLVMIAHAIIYTKMSGTAGGAPNSFGPPMGGGYGGGPPGYGPPGGGYGGPPPGGFGGPPPGGGFGPPPGGGGYGPPAGGGYGPPGGGGGYGGPPGY